MSRFSPVTLVWDGVEYTIPADKMMRAIAIIEDHTTLSELQSGPKPTRIAGAFAAVLTFAGAKGVTDEDVYAALFRTGEAAADVVNAVTNLILMMIPPEHLTKGSGGNAAPGKRPASLSKRSKRRAS